LFYYVLSWLYSAKVIINFEIHLVRNITICYAGSKPWSKPGKEDSHGKRSKSSEEHGGFEKGPQGKQEKNGKVQAFQDVNNNNNDNGESIFIILSDRHCCHWNSYCVLKLS